MKCLTIQEAAERIGNISDSFLYRMCREGQVVHVRMCNRVLIDEDDLPDIINSFKVKPKAQGSVAGAMRKD